MQILERLTPGFLADRAQQARVAAQVATARQAGVGSVLTELALMQAPQAQAEQAAPREKSADEYRRDTDFFARARAEHAELQTLPASIRSFAELTEAKKLLPQTPLFGGSFTQWLKPADSEAARNLYFAFLNATLHSGILAGGATVMTLQGAGFADMAEPLGTFALISGIVQLFMTMLQSPSGRAKDFFTIFTLSAFFGYLPLALTYAFGMDFLTAFAANLGAMAAVLGVVNAVSWGLPAQVSRYFDDGAEVRRYGRAEKVFERALKAERKRAAAPAPAKADAGTFLKNVHGELVSEIAATRAIIAGHEADKARQLANKAKLESRPDAASARVLANVAAIDALAAALEKRIAKLKEQALTPLLEAEETLLPRIAAEVYALLESQGVTVPEHERIRFASEVAAIEEDLIRTRTRLELSESDDEGKIAMARNVKTKMREILDDLTAARRTRSEMARVG